MEITLNMDQDKELKIASFWLIVVIILIIAFIIHLNSYGWKL